MSRNIFKSKNNAFIQNFRWFSNKPIPEMPACDFVPKTYQGPSYGKLHQIRNKNVPLGIGTDFSKPLAFHQGHMQWLFDVEGRRYLDMYGGICTVSVGHSHPKVTEYVSEQISTLGHCSNLYLHPRLIEYAENLTSKMPGDLKAVYFVNSGSEANDLAILISRLYTGNFDIVSLRNGYHGMTYQTMGLSNTAGFKYAVAAPNSVHVAMNPDVYRGPWGGSRCRDSPIQTTRQCSCHVGSCTARSNYLQQLQELYNFQLTPGSVAAFFAESIQGVGGTVQFPIGYLKGAYDLVKQYGGLYIADEVQAGFGRTGDHFWGFEMHGVQPDIVTMAKGIGNGFPLAAVVTTPKIAAVLRQGKHFNTYGGNPVASAAGKAVLEIIEEENLQENSKSIGTYLLRKLANLRDKYAVVGDVRGKGLMIGIELVLGEGTVNALPPEHFVQIWEACKDMGVLFGRGGIKGNVIRIKPPMCITKRDAEFAVAVLDRALDMYMEQGLGNEKIFVNSV